MSERQQLADAIALYFSHGEPTVPGVMSHEISAVIEPHLVAAERAGYERARQKFCIPTMVYNDGYVAGYERCKHDASKGIEALKATAHNRTLSHHVAALNEALAVVAALNDTQQTNDEGAEQ